MAGYINPVASGTGGIAFSRLPADEIRRISVKRLHATPTLDSLLNPVPGGLYDPALGAVKVLDTICTTCRMTEVHCTGHCGHIELPVACYHPQYIETTLRLLRAKCLYCHRLRVPQLRISGVTAQLRLLQHGLLDEYEKVRKMHVAIKSKKQRKTKDDVEESVSDSADNEDAEDLMERQDKYVRKAIRRACKREQGDVLTLIRNPAAVAARKEVITAFLREIAAQKKCSRCQGVTPTYRKDRNVKIFKMPLSSKIREANKQTGLKAVNPLLFQMAERNAKRAVEKPLTNGWHKGSDESMNSEDSTEPEPHGAEEEIALRNALETSAAAKTADLEDEEEVQQYMTPTEVRAALDLLFDREQEVMRLLFSSPTSLKSPRATTDMFFISHVLVPPNKFRPAARQGVSGILEAQQNTSLNRIINSASDVHRIAREMRKQSADTSARNRTHNDHVTAGVALQEAVNGLIDHTPNPASGRQNEVGIKQTLEKKEGLFRMNMMGKRVNYAARSVISPDPNIETNEIGVPLVFAKKLTYPEPVTDHNFDYLKKAVINGMEKYPGAAAVESEKGQILSLKFKNRDQREAIAKALLTPSNPGLKGDQGKKVHRHLQTGDVVVMNRQPTLHKPSMMGHRTRVLKNEKTIRMHYANCNTYNADFDGDEMNMHFPQNEIARAEAFQIADTDHQYLSATAGKPLRGLIQDHLSMGVQFTSRDVFFDKEQYQELLYSCLRPEESNAVSERIKMLPPAILKPKPLWTGKQTVSTILKNLVPVMYDGLNLVGKSSTSADQWGETTEKDPAKFDVSSKRISCRDTEQVVIFKDGEHLCGILDKAQLGPSVGGLVHSIHELYGHMAAGKFLSVIGRLLTRYLNERAWTCGMDDLYLTEAGDRCRRQELSVSARLGKEVSATYVTLEPEGLQDRDTRLLSRLESVLRREDQLAGLDAMYNARTKSITENVTKACLPAGLRKPFPRNQMQAMTISGAKGSNVNANLISCNLGQQVLEGRRVPTMVSGKTLPSFREYETDPVAGGYISGRFLTGIRPQEYFFHAMSGREGLIDTAVKTSKSGYLQRCIVKGLEGLKIEYDTSVREASNGTVVQFLYGEDGLEVTKQKHLMEFGFLAENNVSVAAGMNAQALLDKLGYESLGEKQKDILKSVRRGVMSRMQDPITASHTPSRHIGSTSEVFASSLATYLKDNPERIIRDRKKGIEGQLSKKSFQMLMELKYLRSLVDPGEAVGVVAAQSIGEPSTQMTLNTFHLAGHSTKNVTLGIPRLREIVMTATANPTTPTMTLKLIDEMSVDDGHRFAKSISRLTLAQLIENLTIIERSGGNGPQEEKLYDITIDLFPPGEYKDEYHITVADVNKAFESKFIPAVEKIVMNEFKKKSKEASLSEITASVPAIGASVGRIEEEARPHVHTPVDQEGAEDDLDEDADPDDAKQASTRERRDEVYDEPDDDERAVADASDGDVDSDEESASKKTKSKQGHTGEEELDSDEEAALNALLSKNPHLKKFIFTRLAGKQARIILSYPSNSPKILLLPIIEKAAHQAVIQAIPGINNCALFQENVRDPVTGKNVMVTSEDTGKEEEMKESLILTEGVNLAAIKDYQDMVNPHTIYTNSIAEMRKFYGVEAARASIVKEIDSVFKGHGITVDNRHLNLIADAMTQSGGYQAFSRNGLVKDSGSVLGKMSFETVMGFLKEAVLFGETDPLLGPSARIVAGRRGGMGTGSFDVVVPVS